MNEDLIPKPKPMPTAQPRLAAGTGCVVTTFLTLCGHEDHEMHSEKQQVDQNKIPSCLEEPIQRKDNTHKQHEFTSFCITFEKCLFKLPVFVENGGKKIAQINTAQRWTVFTPVWTSHTTTSLKYICDYIEGEP